jgi:hypothetical protein
VELPPSRPPKPAWRGRALSAYSKYPGTAGRFLPTLDYQIILEQRGISIFKMRARYFYNIFRVCLGRFDYSVCLTIEFLVFVSTTLSVCVFKKIKRSLAARASLRLRHHRSSRQRRCLCTFNPTVSFTMSSKPVTTFWRLAGMSYLQVRYEFIELLSIACLDRLVSQQGIPRRTRTHGLLFVVADVCGVGLVRLVPIDADRSIGCASVCRVYVVVVEERTMLFWLLTLTLVL